MIKLIVANLIFMYFMFLICQEVEGSELMVHGGFSPCDNDSDCEHFPHGQCVDSFCECNGTRFCSDESQTKVTKLGERCHVGADCNIEHSVCEKGECRCESGRVGSEDGRSCLKHGPCIGPLCYGTPSDKSPAPCIVGRCECAEEKQFCTNQAESHLNTKGSSFLAGDLHQHEASSLVWILMITTAVFAVTTLMYSYYWPGFSPLVRRCGLTPVIIFFMFLLFMFICYPPGHRWLKIVPILAPIVAMLIFLVLLRTFQTAMAYNRAIDARERPADHPVAVEQPFMNGVAHMAHGGHLHFD